MEFERNELNKNSKGGTELIMERLYKDLPEELLSNYQIIPSRVRQLDQTKLRVFYAHDLADDPESINAMDKNGAWARFNRIVFVSHWQRNQFIQRFPNIPWSKTAVIKNSIIPFEEHDKPKDKINLIYHTTPHRGLNILVPVFKKLCEDFGDLIHLHVYSSFEIYGWPQRDEQFKQIFNDIKSHKNMTYHGYQSNEVVREALKTSHIYAYPSIWPETSCLSLMEAMSAGLICVHPDLAALPETSGGWTFMYPWHEEQQHHAAIFYNALGVAINNIKNKINDPKLNSQKHYINMFHNWEFQKKHWEAFLLSFKDENREIQTSVKVFNYEA